MRFSLGASLFFCAFTGFCDVQEEVRSAVQSDVPTLESLYKDLHRNPELSMLEEKTSARIAKELREAGYELTERVGGYGVVGVLRNGPGPVVLLRTDLDALPVKEETGAAYASKVRVANDLGVEVDVMHACGHDVHMTMLVGTARLLNQFKSQWRGTV